MFLPPDAENPRKADHDGDWDAETRDLARRGIYVFDQLAPVTATLLERSPALRRLYSDRYPLVIVDEFQDTNLDQWRVIQALAEGSTIICLADPDQRIYEGFIPGVDEARLQQAIDVLARRGSTWPATTTAARATASSTTPTPSCAASPHHYPRRSTTFATATLPRRNRLTHQVILLSPGPARPAARQAAHHRRPGPLQRVRREHLRGALRGPQAPANGRCCPQSTTNWCGTPACPPPRGSSSPASSNGRPCPPPTRSPRRCASIADFYRVKLADKETSGCRSAITAIENAITTFLNGKNAAHQHGEGNHRRLRRRASAHRQPVTDWQLARARLRGSLRLEEVFSKARLLRLLHATDALAWGLNDIWDGQASYPGAADTVRRILADELIAGRPAEPHPVTLMNMHKSKGKEFDAVIIVEGLHHARLLDPRLGCRAHHPAAARPPRRDHPGPGHRSSSCAPGTPPR